jgi:NitT/TauT family transport system substrate-binding protein
MVSRRGSQGRLGYALAIALVAGCSRTEAPRLSPTSTVETVRLQTDWYPQAEHGGFYQAIARGYYAKAGVNTVIVTGGPGIKPLQALMAGYADICVGVTDDVIVDVGNGLPLVIIAVYVEHDPQAILVHDEDSIRSFKDLEGRTMMAGPEQDWITYLRLHYHVNFKVIPLNFGLGEFMADKHFIQQCFVTNEPYYVQKYGGHAHTIMVSDSGYDMYRCLLTTRHFLGEHPRAVRAFVAATIEGWDDFMGPDPEPALKLIMAANKEITPDLLHFSIEAMRTKQLVAGDPGRGERIGLMTRRRLEDQARIMAQAGITSSVMPLESFATFDYLPPDLRAAGLR